MTYWIQNGLQCRLFEMPVYPFWYWSTKWGHHGRPFHSYLFVAIEGQIYYGMFLQKCILNHWSTNGSVHHRSLYEGQWRFMLGQAMGSYIMVWTVGLCLSLQKHQWLYVGAEDSGQGHNGPHLWRREFTPWLEKPYKFFNSSSMWWRSFKLNIFTMLRLFHLRWWLHHHILVVMKKC